MQKKYSFVWVFAALLVVGCGNQEPPLSSINDTNIKKLRAAYGMYLLTHDLQGPASEEELKSFLQSSELAKMKLERMGVPADTIDSIFISQRDGQPFKVKYGLKGMGDYPIVFEAEGVDGKRLIAYTTPREVDAAEYDDLWEKSARGLRKDVAVVESY